MASSATETGPVLPKAVVREALDRMPEDATLREIAEEIAILAALEEAEGDIRAGRMASNEEVKARARTWRSK
jgi:predicted transcriptional regulator